MPTLGAAAPAANPRTRAPDHAVRQGDCVEVAPAYRPGAPDSEGGVGFVTSVNANGTFNIRWVLDNRCESGIQTQRIKSLSPLATTARRTSASNVERPSILCPSHRPAQRSVGAASSRMNVAAQSVDQPAGPSGVSSIIIQSKRWHHSQTLPCPTWRTRRCSHRWRRG